MSLSREQAASARLKQLEADNARLRDLLDQHHVGADLRHQTRNTLATVRALVRRSAENSHSVEDYAAHLEGRLDVILRVQNLVMHHRAGIDLHLLIAEELRVFKADEGAQVRLAGPRIVLQSKAAETLALAFHELATNAVKFGALAVPEGSIDITWTADTTGSPVITLLWKETTVGMDLPAQIEKGFGHEVIESMLKYQLNAEATLSFAGTGLQCEIQLPLPPSIGTVLSRDQTAT